MRKWADRIDDAGALKPMSYSFTFETGEGIRFRDDGRGCRLWHLGDPDYDRAHTESDTARREEARRRELLDFADSLPEPQATTVRDSLRAAGIHDNEQDNA